MSTNGKKRSLSALSGEFCENIPVGLFTWGVDYYWKVAGLEPWELACGSSKTWHKAHMALLERHDPDLLWYTGSGQCDKEPILEREDDKYWYITSGNKEGYLLSKVSYALLDAETKSKGCDSVGNINSKEDAVRLIPEFTGWGDVYLNGLKHLVLEVSDMALVLPHHSPAYICACYAFGFEAAMEKMITGPGLFTYVCDRYASGDELRMQELADAGAEAVFIADGWASCDIISPAMVKQFAMPYQKNIIDAAHKAELKIILWNEGDILPILDEEAALNMDGFAFEQPRKGVELTTAKVREAFGPKRCLLGNLDSELMLLRNDHKEITQAVNNIIKESGKGHPFIMSTGSPVTSDIPTDAVDAMINATRTFNWDNEK